MSPAPADPVTGGYGSSVRTERTRGSDRMAKTGPRHGAEGVVEDLKGKAKEVVGEVRNDDRLRREGEAQQNKARAQRDVAAKEAEADKARAEAKAHEAEQS